MNRSGLWRIVESVVAVLILAGAFLLFANKDETAGQSSYLEELRPTLDEIAQDESIRNKIIKDDSSTLDVEQEIIGILKNRFPSVELEFNVVICDINEASCGSNPVGAENEVYSEERLISSTLIDYKPKILRAYIWQKQK